MKNFSTKQQIFIILILLCLASIGYIVYLAIPNKKQSLQETSTETIVAINPIAQAAKIDSVSFDSQFVFPVIPKQLPGYTDISGVPDILPLAESLANQLRLAPNPALENFWTNADSSIYLVASTQNQTLTYTVDASKKPEYFNGSNVPQKTLALQAAQNFARTNPRLKDFTVDTSRLTFLSSGDSEIAEVSESGAYGLIRIPFEQTVNTYPLHRQAFSVSPLTVTIGQNNQIVKIEAHGQVARVSAVSTDYSTFTQTELKKLLQDGKASLIDVQSNDIILTPLSTLGPVVIQNAYLEYRSSSTGSRILPYWHFIGSTQTNKDYKVHLVLLAVKL